MEALLLSNIVTSEEYIRLEYLPGVSKEFIQFNQA